MKLSKLIYTLSAVAMTTAMAPVMAVEDAPRPTKQQDMSENVPVPPEMLSWVNEQQSKFDRGLPLDTELTAAQLAFLTNYMNGSYTSSSEDEDEPEGLRKAARVLAVIILISDFDVDGSNIPESTSSLEGTSYNSFVSSETMKTGLSPAQITRLFNLTIDLRNNKELSKEDANFLRQVVSKNLEKNPNVGTLPWFRSLVTYSMNNPEFLSPSEKGKLTTAAWGSIGLNSREIKTLTKLGNQQSATSKLSPDEIIALRKFSYSAQTGTFWLMEPAKLLKIQDIMNNNSNSFNPGMLARFNDGVNSDSRIRQFKADQGPRMPPKQVKPSQNEGPSYSPKQPQRPTPAAPAGPVGPRTN